MVSPNKNYFAKGTFVLFKLFYYYFSLLMLITLFFFFFFDCCSPFVGDFHSDLYTHYLFGGEGGGGGFLHICLSLVEAFMVY